LRKPTQDKILNRSDSRQLTGSRQTAETAIELFMAVAAASQDTTKPASLAKHPFNNHNSANAPY